MERFQIDRFHAVNFAVFPHRGVLGTEKSRKSMEEMVFRTHANWVILTPSGMQDTPYSEEIRYDGEKSCTDEELYDMIQYAQGLGLKVALKPTVNCDNGVWRARISFFDHDVPCEPKWGKWFESHIAFQKHYAEIAQQTGCKLFLAGCEMTMTEHRLRTSCGRCDCRRIWCHTVFEIIKSGTWIHEQMHRNANDRFYSNTTDRKCSIVSS